jgi:hypothetical protein
MELSLKIRKKEKMKAFAILALFASTVCLAQKTPAPPQSTKPAQQATAPDSNIDPTADTNDPTLLKAQILLLEAQQQIYQLLEKEKLQKLHTVLNQQAQVRQTDDANKAKSHLHDADKLKAEEAAIAKANDEKKAATKAAEPK